VCLAVALLGLAFVIGEVASIAMLGSYLGVGPTLAVVAIAGVIGVLLLRGRAFATFQKAVDAYRRGERLGPVVASGALVGLAGVLLVIPGALSDLIAVVILLPPVRALLARRMIARVAVRATIIDAQAHEKPGDLPPSLP
jgi:UPF0716 protein FxsA